MPARLEVRITSRFPVATVQLRGPLDFGSAPAARAALRKLVVEQPAAILVDLTHIALTRPAALSVLRAAIRSATDSPAGVPIVVLAPDPLMNRALRRSGFDRLIHLATSAESAAALAAGQPAPLRRVLHGLAPVPESLREVRRAVAGACGAWDVAAVVPEAELVAGELATNAIEHAGTPFDLTIALRQPYVHITIRDGSSLPPKRKGPDAPTMARGRGLLVVDDVAASWGTVEAQDGKVVWATVRIRSAGARPAPADPAVLRLVPRLPHRPDPRD
jgi:anti-anti-sigma factor